MPPTSAPSFAPVLSLCLFVFFFSFTFKLLIHNIATLELCENRCRKFLCSKENGKFNMIL